MRKNIFLCTLVAVFASMQISYADGLANASISSTQGGFVGMENGTNSATLNFNGNATVDWNRLHVGRNETLNFNAVDGARGLTVLNRVTGQFSNIYGTINANSGISHLILSNPHGIIFDGANFNAAGDVTLTTQKLAPLMSADGLEMYGYTGVNELATQSIQAKNSNFNVGGTLKMVGPKLFLIHSNMNTPKFKLVTSNGCDFLVNNYEGGGSRGILMRAVSVNGNVYIESGKDPITINAGSDISGNLDIWTQGDVNLNYSNQENCPEMNVGKLAVHVNTHGDPTLRTIKLRNVHTHGGRAQLTNFNGDIIVRDLNVESENAGYTTINPSRDAILLGENDIDSNFYILAGRNIVIGNQNVVPGKSVPGHLNINGTTRTTITATNGNVIVKDDINTASGSFTINAGKNIITAAGDGSVNGETASITTNASCTSINANKNNGYVGAVEDSEALDNFMSNNTPIDDSAKGYMNFSGASAWINAGEARIKAHNDFTVGASIGCKLKKLFVTAVDENDPLGASVTIRSNVQADEVIVGEETKELYVPQESRSYDLTFTNIHDNEVTEIAADQALTYEDFNAQGGYNDGVQTQSGTWVDAPTEPNRLLQDGPKGAAESTSLPDSPKGAVESTSEEVVIDEDFLALNKKSEGIQNKLKVAVDAPSETNEKQVKKVDKTISSELKTLPLMTSKKRK